MLFFLFCICINKKKNQQKTAQWQYGILIKQIENCFLLKIMFCLNFVWWKKKLVYLQNMNISVITISNIFCNFLTKENMQGLRYRPQPERLQKKSADLPPRCWHKIEIIPNSYVWWLEKKHFPRLHFYPDLQSQTSEKKFIPNIFLQYFGCKSKDKQN